MIFGARTAATDVVRELETDTVTTIAVTLPSDLHLAKVALACDGFGSGSGDAKLRAALYDDAGALVAVGEEVVVEEDASGRWRDLPFADAGLLLAAGDYTVAVQAGGATRSTRIYGAAVAAEQAADAYADGAADVLPALTPVADGAAIYLAAFEPWQAPDVDDDHLARLPWVAAQDALAGASASGSAISAAAGWHGVEFDVEQGANAIVPTDGLLADLVGERLRVTYSPASGARSVIVYVHDERDFGDGGVGEDISLTRAAWSRLAPLALEQITVVVEVVA